MGCGADDHFFKEFKHPQRFENLKKFKLAKVHLTMLQSGLMEHRTYLECEEEFEKENGSRLIEGNVDSDESDADASTTDDNEYTVNYRKYHSYDHRKKKEPFLARADIQAMFGYKEIWTNQQDEVGECAGEGKFQGVLEDSGAQRSTGGIKQ